MDDSCGESLKMFASHALVYQQHVSLLTLKNTNGRMTFAAPIV